MRISPVTWAVWATAGLSLPVAAQTPSAAPSAAPSTADSTLVITGNPLGADGLAQPATVLSGDALLRRRSATLGDTLDGLPGTAASTFGPNSSRPVIRGLDGDRVRLLDNGGASVDASNLSFDHAVTLDPLVVERIEVLRGPAALLYGGNATGGVVNTLDNRLPRAPAVGLGGRAELRLGGAAAERNAAVVLDGGQGPWAWHVDAFGRSSSDLRVPAHDAVDDEGSLRSVTRVRNSAARGEGGALGLSRVSQDGYLGLAVDTYRSRYGITVEPDVFIRMQRDRLQFDTEQRGLKGLFDEVRVQASSTRYRHEEVEGSGDVGTVFASRGHDLRLQARHAAWGPWRGVIGVQAERLRFSALGEEAFVPATLTRSQALFLLEEATFGALRLQAGWRGERVQVSSDGDEAADEPRFGAAAQRRFTPTSASLGLSWKPSGGWALGATVGHTERAPAYYELFANGVHVATAAYERGDAQLGVERSRNLGATLEWRGTAADFKLSLHDTRFARFISLAASGRDIAQADGGTVPEYRFEAVRAQLNGFEVEARWRVPLATGVWQLTAQADAVRATDLDRGTPLPRIAPLRLQAGADWSAGPWTLGLALRHAARQNRVAPGDRPTPASTLLNAWASWRLPLPSLAATAFLRLDNLGNRLAYNATAVPTVRELAPQGGRAVTVGLRVEM